MSHALNKLAAELGHAYRTAKKTLPAEDRLVPVLRDLLRDIGQRLRPSPGASLQANVARGPEHVPALLELFSALASPGTPPAGALCPAPLSPPPLRRPGVRFGGAEQLEFEVSSDEVSHKLRPGRRASSLPEPSPPARAHSVGSTTLDPPMELIDEDGNPRDFISVEGADLEPLGETEGPSWDEGVEPPVRQCGAVPGLAAATCPAAPDLLLAGSLAERIRKVSEDNNKRLLEEIREALGKRDAPVA